jgi:hypothetical protein
MAAGDLTDLATVKVRMTGIGDGFDAAISQLITEISAQIINELGKPIVEATYTDEYYDGDGTNVLTLRHGPLVSITSMESVIYTKSSIGALVEDLTTIDAGDVLMDGLRTAGHLKLGKIIRRNNIWSHGQRNYKLTYVAGFDSAIPQGLEIVATREVILEFLERERPGVSSESIGDGSITMLSPRQRMYARRMALAPYAVENQG